MADGADRKRNPPWARDELILALELYVRRGQVGPTDPDLIAVSDLLNSLPIHTMRPDQEKFRNPNGVGLKLANFAALDPAYQGTGMSRGGKLDAEVWDEFHDKQDELARVAAAIRAGAASSNPFPVAPEDGEDEYPEGRLLYRAHRARERNRKLVADKKRAVLAAGGALNCEECGFNFESTYGDVGKGYIECHHTVPLAEAGQSNTRLADVVLLCANCHRMAHRRTG